MADLNDEELKRIELMHEMLTSEQSGNENNENISSVMEEILTPTPVKEIIKNETKKDEMAYELVDSFEEKLEKVLNRDNIINEKFKLNDFFIISVYQNILPNTEYTKYVYKIQSIDSDNIYFFHNDTGLVKIPKDKIFQNLNSFICIDPSDLKFHISCKKGDTEFLFLCNINGGKLLISRNYDVIHDKKTIRKSITHTYGNYLRLSSFDSIKLISKEEYNNIVNEYVLETKYNSFYKSSTFLKNREIFEAMLNDLYPDLWYYKEHYNERSDESSYNETFSLITYMIRFPKIKITNSNHLEHTIEDLLIIFDIGYNFKCMHTKPKGCRITMTTDEIEAGYMHSHLSQNISSRFYNYASPGIFCIGDGQPISIPCATVYKQFDENAWLSLLMQIPSFLCWESLEGVPHIKMEKIGKKSSNYRQIYYDPNVRYSLSDYRIIEKINVNLLKELKYVVIKDQYTKLDKIAVLPESILEFNKKNKLFKDVYYNNGTYYTKSSTTNNYSEHTRACIDAFYIATKSNTIECKLSSYHENYMNIKNSKHESTELYFNLINKNNETEYDLVPDPTELKGAELFINNIIN